MKLHCVFACLLLALASCAPVTPQRFYSAPNRHPSRVARLWNLGTGGGAEVVAVDGRPLDKSYKGAQIAEVLPGMHQVTIIYPKERRNVVVPWQAAAGGVYELKFFSDRPVVMSGTYLLTPKIVPETSGPMFPIVEDPAAQR